VFEIYLFTYTDSAMIAGSLCHQVKLTYFSGRRLTVSMSSAIKQLNTKLTAYG